MKAANPVIGSNLHLTLKFSGAYSDQLVSTALVSSSWHLWYAYFAVCIV
jgi:hypothetical protein